MPPLKDKYVEHVTLSGSILERLAINYFEKKLGRKVICTEWIQNEDYGFAGFRMELQPEEVE